MLKNKHKKISQNKIHEPGRTMPEIIASMLARLNVKQNHRISASVKKRKKLWPYEEERSKGACFLVVLIP